MKTLTWEEFWVICQKQCPRMDYDFATEQWDRGVSPKDAINVFNRISRLQSKKQKRRVNEGHSNPEYDYGD